jgi:hypothetical protein
VWRFIVTHQLERLIRPLLAALLLIGGFLVIQRPTPSAAQLDARYFSESGFRIDNDQFWDIFQTHGRDRGLGPPISRTFRLLGRPTQIFERHILQIAPEGHAYIVSLLQDQLLFPYRSINGSIFPEYDITLVAQAPIAGSDDYDTGIIEYIKQWVPDTVDGQPVNFFERYLSAVRDREGDLRVLANLPVWGIATSHPQRDPANPRVIYQRFERGMMVYEAGCRCTRVLPLGELFKSVLTGQNLPADFETQEPNSPFLRQYDVELDEGPFRESQLPDTELDYAFRPSAVEPVSWATVAEVAPPGPDPFAFTVAPTSTPVFQPTTAPPTAIVPPTPTQMPGPFSRDPSTVALQMSDIGREATVVRSLNGSDTRAKWYEVRYERDRGADTVGLGPSIWYQKVYVATNSEMARSIFREESANTNFPESVDRHLGFFENTLERLVEEQRQLASCEEEGCAGIRYFIHLRTVMRNANVVSVLYTYGDQQYAGSPDILPNLRKIAERMRA